MDEEWRVPDMGRPGTKPFDNWMNTFLTNSMQLKNSMQQIRVGSRNCERPMFSFDSPQQVLPCLSLVSWKLDFINSL